MAEQTTPIWPGWRPPESDSPLMEEHRDAALGWTPGALAEEVRHLQRVVGQVDEGDVGAALEDVWCGAWVWGEVSGRDPERCALVASQGALAARKEVA